MYSSVDSVTTSSNIPEEWNLNLIILLIITVLNSLPSISNDIRMIVPPRQSGRLGIANISCYLCNLKCLIDSLLPFFQEKQFVIASHFVLKTLLKFFLSLSHLLIFLEEVQMSEHSHDLGKTMALEQWQKLKSLHLKAQTSINNEQHHVSYFWKIDHCSNIVRTFDDSYSLLFIRSESNSARHLINLVFCVVFDERSDDWSLTWWLWTLNNNHKWRVGLHIFVWIEKLSIVISFLFLFLFFVRTTPFEIPLKILHLSISVIIILLFPWFLMFWLLLFVQLGERVLKWALLVRVDVHQQYNRK